jgi:hypothetical protein
MHFLGDELAMFYCMDENCPYKVPFYPFHICKI